MRKKPTNLTLGEDIKSKAADLMKAQSFGKLTALVEQLIRDKHAEIFGVQKKVIPEGRPEAEAHVDKMLQKYEQKDSGKTPEKRRKTA